MLHPKASNFAGFGFYFVPKPDYPPMMNPCSRFQLPAAINKH
jgi:hypothetical protein